MKILLVSWYFPPINDVAAVRTGAMAEYFRKQGHDVVVLTAARVGDASLALPTTPDKIRRTRWFDVDALRVRSEFDSVAGPKTDAQVGAPQAGRTWLKRARAWASDAYTQIAHLPDRQVGWFFFAVAAGRELAKNAKFDLIYASGPPFTTFLVARSLSRQFGVPWIAEYRDAWSRYFYVPRPAWRQALDERMENATVRGAAAIVAVTPPWADYYRERFGKPTAAVYNGFDAQNVGAAQSEPARDKPVSIAYFGVLYEGLRDPSPLYRAVGRSGLTPADVQIVYYGPTERDVRHLTKKFDVDAFVTVRPRLAYAESLRSQRASDVLLLLQAPDDPRNVPAKLFEYLAAERPILGLGLDDGIPATLIRDRQAGFYRSDPDAIAEQLRKWVGEKRQSGTIAATPSSARKGLSREEQFEGLERFLLEVLAGQSRAR